MEKEHIRHEQIPTDSFHSLKLFFVRKICVQREEEKLSWKNFCQFVLRHFEIIKFRIDIEPELYLQKSIMRKWNLLYIVHLRRKKTNYEKQ